MLDDGLAHGGSNGPERHAQRGAFGGAGPAQQGQRFLPAPDEPLDGDGSGLFDNAQ